MSALLTIGEFSRLSHVSVKALRHYDEVGLSQPASVDPTSGYRRYASAQVPIAQVIRRFRDLDMPLDDIKAVLEAPTVEARDQAIVAHLERMQAQLEQTQATVASLQALLEGRHTPLPVRYRSVSTVRALSIAETVDWDETEAWLGHALAEIAAVLAPNPHARAGADAALYSPEYFEAHRGEVVAFVPILGDPAPRGRVRLREIPPAQLAVTVHE